MLDRVVVTGSSGFVGRSLALRLGVPFERLHLGAADWREALAAASFSGATVFHLAARVHRGGDADESAYRRDNVDKSAELARVASSAGARRLVFLSSAKVLGEETRGRPFRRGDAPDPRDAYARSKWAAEQELARISATTAMELVIVRAPLVFGAGAAGNLRSLIGLADTAWPLPFASIRNRRSFVHVDDLARLLVACGEAPDVGPGTYLAANSRSHFSTPGLVALIRAALGRPARLVPVPPLALEAAAFAVGRQARIRPLTRSLEIDASETESQFGWTADIPLESAVAGMVAGYRSERAA